jgi:hypothetical protein
MNPLKRKGQLQIRIILMLSLCLLLADRVTAQSTIEIRCGTFDQTAYPKPIPGFMGEYYYTKRAAVTDPNHVWEFGVFTEQGEKTFQTPFSQDLALRIAFPRISPDGTKMVFPPLSSKSIDLVVWNIATAETATFPLTQELADYILRPTDYSEIDFNKLIWRNQSELAIQYFGENGNVRNPLQTLDLTIRDQPLRITASAPAIALNLQATPNPNPSSQETFATSAKVFTVETRESPAVLGGREFRVTDTASRAVVFTVQSSKEYRVGQPFWTPDGNYLFYLAVVPSGMKLIQVNVGQGFTQETALDSILEKQFGTSTGITTTIPPILSRDGTNLGFGYLDQIHNQYYVIRYNPRTGETTTVCDEAPISGDLYPFWSPSNRFIAYWYSGTVKVYDFDTGNRYLLPGKGFAGWISEEP